MNTSKETVIPQSHSYEGYYWMSDADKPVIVSGALPKVLESLDPMCNPFVIEAQLYDTGGNVSYSVKYIDGQYHIYKFSEVDDRLKVATGKYDHITLKKYQSHRMDGRKLLFLQYWDAEEDALCAGDKPMPVLQPGALVFVGFENSPSNQKIIRS